MVHEAHDDRARILALAATEKIGWRLINRLLERFGSLEAIFSASAADLQTVQGIGAQIAASIERANPEQAAADLAAFEQAGIAVATWQDAAYPAAFNQLEDRPLVVFRRGILLPADSQAIAIVGTREPSPEASQMAYRWAASLAWRGWIVVSGLARGIDSQAHRGALETGGRTLAVLGVGFNHIYPPEAAALAAQIAANGALISEVHPELAAEPTPSRLVMRNRLITALSRAVIVIEAGASSGALHAAHHAHAQGRPVYVLDNSDGNRLLLDQFAGLLPESVDELLARVARKR